MRRASRALCTHVSPGLIALLATIAVALLAGTAWRWMNGQMRAPRGQQQSAGAVTAGTHERNGVLSPLVATPVAAAVPSAGTVAGSPAGMAMPPEPSDRKLRLTGEQIGRALGERATLVQFSSAFCAPCRATRQILADVAGMTGGVEYVEIDAESRLDLVRRLSVLRTPTVLVLDADGGVVRRASGQPRKADVIAAIGIAVGL
jgi:thiol-disulfide isomerase/thioredoxin